jgi:hypothetical protein
MIIIEMRRDCISGMYVSTNYLTKIKDKRSISISLKRFEKKLITGGRRVVEIPKREGSLCWPHLDH